MTVVNIDIVAHSAGDDSLKKKKKSKRQHNEVENGGLYVRILVCALNNSWMYVSRDRCILRREAVQEAEA